MILFRVAPGQGLDDVPRLGAWTPGELPCRPQHADGPLCERAAALADVKQMP